MHVVYLIQHSVTKMTYVGVTTDLKKRLKSHNEKRNASTNRKNGKWILIYAEAYRSRKDAFSRESKLKHHGSGKHELLKRLKYSLLETKSEAG